METVDIRELWLDGTVSDDHVGSRVPASPIPSVATSAVKEQSASFTTQFSRRPCCF
jgi:hypothetical protein